MSPLGNTMRFIHGKKGDFQIRKKFEVFLLGEGLRRHIEHLGLARLQVIVYFLDFFFGKGGIEKMCHFIIAAITPDQVHLVFHERNQRGNNNGYAVQHHGGQLVAQAFPSAGGHDHKRITSGHQGFNRFFLCSFEFIKTEVLLQRFVQIKPGFLRGGLFFGLCGLFNGRLLYNSSHFTSFSS